MTAEEHNIEVAKLNCLEDELTGLIMQTNDSALMDKFTEWAAQRTVCNEGYLSYLKALFPKV